MARVTSYHSSAQMAALVMPVVLVLLASGTSFAVVPPEVTLVATFQQAGDDRASYGEAVAIEGNIAVVGSATSDYHNCPESVYIYDFSDPSNVVERRLFYPSVTPTNLLGKFGMSVAISGSYVFVGAPNEENRGAVYMYDISDMSNITYRTIVAFDNPPFGNFGCALAVDGTRLLVGNPQLSAGSTQAPAAYLVDFADPLHIQQQKIVHDPSTRIGRFSETLDIDGNCAIIGDWDHSTGGNATGSAYLYDLTDPSNMTLQQLAPQDAEFTEHFGQAVAISGDTVLVAAHGELGPVDYPGGATGVLYAHDCGDFQSITQTEFGIPRSNGAAFGRDVDLDGDLAVVAAAGLGRTYLYDLSDPASPVQLSNLYTVGAESAAIDGRTFVVAGNHVAHVFRVVPEPSGIALVLVLVGLFSSCRPRHGIPI